MEIFDKFTSAPLALRTNIPSSAFKALIKDKTHDFVGREYIFDLINSYTTGTFFDSGYLLLIGEPGVGKTTLLAEFVRREGCVHHFNMDALGIRSPQTFLANISSQLIIRYNLDYNSLPNDATADGSFLTNLLEKVSYFRKNIPVLLLVDGINEVNHPNLSAGANILYLPMALPDGVYVIISARPGKIPLVANNIAEIPMNSADERNFADIRKFLIKTQNKMHKEIDPQFIETLVQRSGGNFQYIRFILNEVMSGRIAFEDIKTTKYLPPGLNSFYQQHWRKIISQDKEFFEHIQRPILCCLAIAKEPVSPSMLSEWTGLTEQVIKRALSDWRAFLNTTDKKDGEVLYSIYHKSFAEFLESEEDLSLYHGLIAESALAKIR